MEHETNVNSNEVLPVSQRCSILKVLEILGRKWFVFVIAELMSNSVLSFSEIQARLSGEYGENISARTLSNVLKILEAEGIIARRVIDNIRPTRVEYYLTEKGDDFDIIFGALKAWGVKWGGALQKQCKANTCVHNFLSPLDLSELRETFVPLRTETG